MPVPHLLASELRTWAKGLGPSLGLSELNLRTRGLQLEVLAY